MLYRSQEIPVQMLEGSGPEKGERAEPIAMGRQTLWGGAGKPPSRDVMAAAAKAARQEMMGRIRENKAKQGERQPRGDRAEGQAGEGQQARGPRPSRHGNQPSRRHGEGQGQRQDRPQHARGPRPEGQGNGAQGQGQRREQNQNRDRRPRDGDELPRHIDPLKTTQFAKLDLPRRKPVKTGGQPDPTRTSIDSLAAGGKRHGGGGGGFGGNRGGGRFR